MTQIPVSQIRMGILCHRHAAVSQNLAEGVNVHAVHQTSLGEVVPQSVRGVGHVNACPSQIPLEPGFKEVDFQWLSALLGEHKLAAGVPILVPQPPLEAFGGLDREENVPGAAIVGAFSRKANGSIAHVQIICGVGVPCEEGLQIPDVIVDGGCADGLREVPPACGAIGDGTVLHGIEGVFSTLLQAANVVADGGIQHLSRRRQLYMYSSM